jgi:hypothetical protein
MKTLNQNDIIIQAIKYSQGQVDLGIMATVLESLNDGFWSCVKFYSNKIKISAQKNMNEKEIWEALKSGKAILSDKIFITYQYGLPCVNGKNINISDLKNYAGMVAIVNN